MKDKEYFDRLATIHGTYQAYPLDEYLRILKNTGIQNESRQKKILEVGCGAGFFSLYLRQFGFKVVGLDISKELTAIANNRIKDNTSINFCTGDILNLPFKNNSFDIIFSGAVMHHLPKEINKSIFEFHRVLSPTGKLFLFEPYFPSLNSFLWYWVFCINRTKEEKALNPRKLDSQFKNAGFAYFRWKIIKKVKHAYFLKKDRPLQKIFGILRKLGNEYFLPNVFFTGIAEKI